MSVQLSIDESWTLFLDRDGVINRKLEGDYVKSWEEFEFLPDVERTIRYLSMFFGRVIVVTNQQGVGKELMTKHDLHDIHDKMLAAIEEAGGHIDRVYYCPDLEEDESPCRKPEIGMAMWAKRDFPEIDFRKSIMIGDRMSDIQFGTNAGMKSFLVSSDKEAQAKSDFVISDLSDFLKFLL